jgi:hypothetical protein
MADTKTSVGDRPKLGDFTRPSAKKPGDDIPENEKMPVTPKPVAADPPAEMTPPETTGEKTAQARVDLYTDIQDAMLPVEDYRKYLEEHDISEEDAARIVDDLMTKGYYEEEIPITRRVSMKLRTREQRDVVRVQLAMQVQRPLFQDSMSELVSRYNLAASLAAYNGKEYYFPGPTDSLERVDELFDERLKVVEKLAAAVFSRLTMSLAKFDRKVLAVMREGVAENF